MKAGWKKDTLSRAYHEFRKEYKEQKTLAARKKQAELEAIDAIAIQLVEDTARRISANEVKH